MSALTSRALQEQLAAIMAALTTAAVAEICELVDEGYAELQLEIRRSHRENEDLKQKLHLIESIVLRGGAGGGKAPEPEVQVSAELSPEAGTPPRPDGGAAGLSGRRYNKCVVIDPPQLPEVVLIKDEDSDSDDTFEEDNKPMAVAISTPVGRSVKRRWPGHEDTERQSSSEQLTLKTSNLTAGTPKTGVVVYSLDSPRSEPGCSGQFGGEEVKADSSHMDPDVHLLHQEGSMISPTQTDRLILGAAL
ncbi:unnamed protein product [Pleuronectes platessa]|uniref:Uncharacterized protein n=1 Tax=Pleuronectes platessa TaxID=8262 RepID=A0A9N7U6X9_PLEPL|nr:unnamed protein product [Pleuronectes platessa]